MKAIRAALGFSVAALLFAGCGAVSNPTVPFCPEAGRNLTSVILIAQAVPSAAYAPCIANLPPGWTFGGERIRNGRAEFWLDSDRAGLRAVTVSLARTCDVSAAVEVPPETPEPLIKQFEEPGSLPPRFAAYRYYVFPGGCTTYHFAFSSDASFMQAVEVTHALSFVSRALGARALASVGVTLCGRGVPCPG